MKKQRLNLISTLWITMWLKDTDNIGFFWLVFCQKAQDLNVIYRNVIEALSARYSYISHLNHRCAFISLLLTTAPCVRLLFITMNMSELFMKFFFCIAMCRVGNVKVVPCQPSFTSTSQPNSLPLPLTKRSIPYSSGFSMYSYPN